MVKLPHMAKEMEKELYRVAETREVYSDLSTLRERLRQVATTLADNDFPSSPPSVIVGQRRRRRESESSRNVRPRTQATSQNQRPRAENLITIHVRILPPDMLDSLFGGHGHLRMLRPLLEGHGNIEELLNHLMEHDPNRHGAPPASATVVENLPLLTITDDHVTRKDECSVCRDVFTVGAQVKEMPCKHLFCPSCIEPWLKDHNSCPNCRDELPTDDVDYEERKRERVI